MGVLAPGSAHARPSAHPPIDSSGNFPAHVSAESSSNISPTPQKSYPKSRNPMTTFEIKKTHLKTLFQGAMGGLQIFCGVNISFFCKNKPPVKFQNSNWPPSKIFQKKPKKT